jgi:hypothetical protein
MRELTRRELPRKVVGQAALTKSLSLLFLRCVRFSQHRARTPAERAWAARLADELAAALAAARENDAKEEGP